MIKYLINALKILAVWAEPATPIEELPLPLAEATEEDKKQKKKKKKK